MLILTFCLCHGSFNLQLLTKSEKAVANNLNPKSQQDKSTVVKEVVGLGRLCTSPSSPRILYIYRPLIVQFIVLNTIEYSSILFTINMFIVAGSTFYFEKHSLSNMCFCACLCLWVHDLSLLELCDHCRCLFEIYKYKDMNIQITWAGLFKEIPRLDMGEFGFGWEVGHYSWMDTMCSLLEQHDFNEHPLECCKKRIHSEARAEGRLVSWWEAVRCITKWLEGSILIMPHRFP